MTSTPASRSARATTLAPRSWPSSPTFATITRILPMSQAYPGGRDAQFTQGMPFVALITPPAGPLDALEEAGLDADGVLAALLPALVLALAGKAAPAPSSTSTWPAATDELA